MYRELHKKLLGGAAVIAIAAGASSFAAQPAAAGGAADWTGFTVGGHIGAAWSEWGGFWATSTDQTHTANFNVFDDSGITGGMHVGYNLMVPDAAYGLDVVVGAEADWSAVGMAGQDEHGNLRCDTNGNIACNAHIESTASLRGRLGLALGRIHTYGTLGVGWVDADAFIGSSSSGQSFRFNDASFVWGAGFEYMMAPNLVVGAEYLRWDSDQKEDIFFNVTSDDSRDHNLKFEDLSVIRVKASYKFGAPPPHHAMK